MTAWGELFPALRVRDYRLFWLGWFISQTGNWMQTVAWGWLVLSLTNSAWWLGVIGFCGGAPALLLSPVGGALAERYDPRKLLLMTQSGMMLLSLSLAALLFSGQHRLWQIIIIALLTGTAFAIDVPVRQSYIPTLAGKENLMNAIGLNSIAFNAARVIGPALAGLLLGFLAPSWIFLINGITFLAILLALLHMRPQAPLPVERPEPLLGYLGQGFGYLYRRKDLFMLVLLIAVMGVFGTVYYTLLPIFARDVFRSDARGLGLLTASMGFGAIIGSFAATQFQHVRRKGLVMVICYLAFCLAVLGFAVMKIPLPAYFLLAVVGLAFVYYSSCSNSLVQTLADNQMRGRVVGIYFLAVVGMGPFSALFAGALAQSLGVQVAVLIGGTISLSMILAVLLFYPRILRLKE